MHIGGCVLGKCRTCGDDPFVFGQTQLFSVPPVWSGAVGTPPAAVVEVTLDEVVLLVLPEADLVGFFVPPPVEIRTMTSTMTAARVARLRARRMSWRRFR